MKDPDGLLALFSEPIGDAYVHFLEELGVWSAWAVAGGRWEGSPRAVAAGLAEPMVLGPEEV